MKHRNEKETEKRERENIIIKYTNHNSVTVCHYYESTSEGHPTQPERDGV